MSPLKRRRMRLEAAVKEARGVPFGYPENLARADRHSRTPYFRWLRRELDAAGIDTMAICAEELSRGPRP